MKKIWKKRKGMTLVDRLRGVLRLLPHGSGGLLGLGSALLPLSPTLALLSPRLLPLVGRSVVHLGAPAAPPPIRLRASRTTVPLQMMAGHEPAAAALQKTPPPAGTTTWGTTNRLTTGQDGTSFSRAHGRFPLPVGSSPGAGAADSTPGRFFTAGSTLRRRRRQRKAQDQRKQ
jgi:hypothetical protein